MHDETVSADFTLRFNTALAARFTRYSTFGSQSKKSRTSGDAKPPSSRTRSLALGKALLTRVIRRRRIPSAPSEPVAFPRRNTAVTKYCSASSLKVRKQSIGKQQELS